MLIQAQKDQLAHIAQAHGVDALKEVFTIAMLVMDVDTMEHISTVHANMFTADEQEIMTGLVNVLKQVNAEMEAAEIAEPHTLH